MTKINVSLLRHRGSIYLYHQSWNNELIVGLFNLHCSFPQGLQKDIRIDGALRSCPVSLETKVILVRPTEGGTIIDLHSQHQGYEVVLVGNGEDRDSTTVYIV